MTIEPQGPTNGASKRRARHPEPDKPAEQPAAAPDGAQASPPAALIRQYVLEALALRRATVDEVQSEVIALAGGTHVPAGVVATTLDGLVLQQLVGLEKGKYSITSDGLAAVKTRRALALRKLAAGPATLTELAAEVGAPAAAVLAELDELVRRGWIRRPGDPLSDSWTLNVAGRAVLDGHAATGAAASTVPVLVPEPEPPKPDFQAKLMSELDAEKKAHAATQMRLTKIADWLRDHGVHEPDLLITQPAKPSGRKTFVWTSKVKVDAAEKSRIFDEVMKLEAEIALAEVHIDGQKANHKAAVSLLNDQIGELKAAAQSGTREIAIEAYRETDWDGGVVIIRATADDRELAREPIPRGEQRPVPGTEEKPKGKKGKAKDKNADTEAKAEGAAPANGATPATNDSAAAPAEPAPAKEPPPAIAPPGTKLELTPKAFEKHLDALFADMPNGIPEVDVPAALEKRLGADLSADSIRRVIKTALLKLLTQGLIKHEARGDEAFYVPTGKAAKKARAGKEKG